MSYLHYCPKCGAGNNNESTFCSLEPEGWSDSPLIIADQERSGPSRVALYEAQLKREATITPVIKRVISLPTTPERKRAGRATKRAAANGHWEHSPSGQWSWVVE